MNINDTCREWFAYNLISIPMSVVNKLSEYDEDDLMEITPPAVNDRVCAYYEGCKGEITKISRDYINDKTNYQIHLDDGRDIWLEEDEFEVEPDNLFPMWGTMWAFKNSCDNDWLSANVEEMASCGFRIYESKDYEYLFGIDGAGYDFYEAHWIPLYRTMRIR